MTIRSFLTPANLSRLYTYFKPFKWRMSIVIAMTVIAASLHTLYPQVIVMLLEKIQKGATLQTLHLYVGGLVVMFFFQSSMDFLKSYILTFVGERLVMGIRVSLYEHLSKLSFDFYSKRRVGDLVSRLSNDVYSLNSVLTRDIPGIIGTIIVLCGSLFFMFRMNVRFTLFVLAIAPFLTILTKLFAGRIEALSTLIQDQLADGTVIAEEGLQGARIVKSFGREKYEVGRYYDAMMLTFKSSMRMTVISGVFSVAMGFFGTLAITAVVYMGGREVILGRLGLPEIAGFLIYGETLAATLGTFSSLYAKWRSAFGGIRRVFELLDTPPTIQDVPGAIELQSCQGNIKLDKVNFSYDGIVPVIKDFSLEVQPGEVMAIVGMSGAGKSTLFNLIPRFYDPSSGGIYFDGQDIRGITQESLRNQIAIVPQDTMLFGGTIRENLLYGRLDATEEELIAAAKTANAHNFIVEFPDQYATFVGERGINLSGGQRQRLAIARAILRNSNILLLDEATSALDNESEELVQDALANLMQKKMTTLIIAHRLSTVKVADRIAVMDRGELVELGTHDELMALNGLYGKLYNMQFRTEEDTENKKP